MAVCKYERWYYNIINKCIHENRNEDIDGVYYEKHHIIPASIGGSDDANNLVLLTYREHVLCHWLLYKFAKDHNKNKMATAFFAMVNLKGDCHKSRMNGITSLRILEAARIAHIEASRERALINNPMACSKTRKKVSDSKKGKKRSIESRIKQGESVKGAGNGFYNKTHSKETKLIMSKKAKDRSSGVGNPNAKKIVYKNEIFECKKFLQEKYGISLYMVNRMIETGEVKYV